MSFFSSNGGTHTDLHARVCASQLNLERERERERERACAVIDRIKSVLILSDTPTNQKRKTTKPAARHPPCLCNFSELATILVVVVVSKSFSPLYTRARARRQKKSESRFAHEKERERKKSPKYS